MDYQNQKINETRALLLSPERLGALQNKSDILKAVEFRALFDELKTLPPEQRASFGKELNQLKNELQELATSGQQTTDNLKPIDVTAPFDINVPADKQPHVLSSENGSVHPLMRELEIVLDIFYRMGFVALEPRQIDDDYHMFTSLNFPEGHPARDDYDTLVTVEKDKDGKPFVAPAHVSIMQNRLQKMYKQNLDEGKPIAVVYPGRTFRNDELDARHEHTFYQVELSYIDKNVNAGHLVATIRAWLSNYFQKEVKLKIQPFYFPFTEPSFEFAASCPFCDQQGCNICSYSGWIELGGCGMVHPNVLKEGGIDPSVYTGFAGGFGLERLVMLKYGIEDIRHFESGKLDFLRQFR